MVINIYNFKNNFYSFKKTTCSRVHRIWEKISTLSKRADGSIKQCFYIVTQFKNARL